MLVTKMEDLSTIVNKARNGDLAAYSAIVRRFQDMAVGYAHSILGDYHLAEDAAQEAFAEAYGSLANLRQPKAFAGWFRKVVYKHCDRLQRRRPRSVSLEDMPETASLSPDPVQALEDREFSRRVEGAVRVLPDDQRQVVTLFYMGGYSHREIASFLGVESHWVNNRLYAARRRLKEEVLDMVEDNLRNRRPSRDDKFARLVDGRVGVEAGQLEYVEELLAQDGGLVDAKDGDGQTLLHRAAYRGQAAIVRLLLKRGAQVNARDRRLQTPLHQLSYVAQSVEAAGILLGAEADINAIDSNGHSPMQLAALHIDSLRQGCWGPPWWYPRFLLKRAAQPDVFSAAILDTPKTLRQLLASDPDLVHARDEDGGTPLHHAADRGNVRAVQMLLDEGAEIDVRDAKGQTPLSRAALWTQVDREFDTCHEAFDLLVERGANMDAFICALSGQQNELAEMLLTEPGMLQATDTEGNTLLHLASRAGQGDLVGFLLGQGVLTDQRNQAGETALDLAAMARRQSTVHNRGERPIAAILDGMKKTLSSLVRCEAECSVFTAACLAWRQRLDQLLDADPDLLAGSGTDGRSLLRYAAEYWQWLGGDDLRVTLEYLLERGAKPDIWTAAALGRQDLAALCLSADGLVLHAFDGELTPLHCAAMAGEEPMVKYLLGQGASPNSRGLWGRTPLHLAAWGGHTGIVECLLDSGAKIEATAIHQVTPLIIAVMRGQTAVGDVLLSRGAQVEARTSYGCTPLGFAVMANREDIAIRFARCGADLTVKDYLGLSPISYTGGRGNSLLHWAARRGDLALVRAILEEGGEIDRVDGNGATPADLAAAEGHEEVAELLRQAARGIGE